MSSSTSKMLTPEQLKCFPLYREFPNGRKLIFIHINKTGGTSLRSVFSFPKEDLWKGQFRKHYRYSDLTDVLPASVLEQSVIATFVRNPWDRIVSLYHYRKQQAVNRGFSKHPENVYASFATWFDYHLDQGKFRSRNLSPQLHWICDDQGTEKANFVGRFEALEEDICRLGKLLGIEPLPVPHLNKSNRIRDYRSFFTPAIKEAVHELYATDIKRFEYQF